MNRECQRASELLLHLRLTIRSTKQREDLLANVRTRAGTELEFLCFINFYAIMRADEEKLLHGFGFGDAKSTADTA